MINRIEIKKDAKEKVKKHITESIKIMLILFFISFAAGFVSGIIMGILNIDIESNKGNLITYIIELILNGLFSFGMLSFYLKLSRNEETNYNELFSKTNMSTRPAA